MKSLRKNVYCHNIKREELCNKCCDNVTSLLLITYSNVEHEENNSTCEALP